MRTIFSYLIIIILTSCANDSELDRKLGKNAIPTIDKYSISKCKQDCKGPEKIVNNSYQDNALDLKLLKLLGCLDSVPTIQFSKDTLSILINPPDSIDVACDCFFDIEMRIKNLNSNPKVILLNNRQITDLVKY